MNGTCHEIYVYGSFKKSIYMTKRSQIGENDMSVILLKAVEIDSEGFLN